MYGEWFHLDGLDEGEREVRVELSANSHNPLALDGEIIDDSQTLEVEVSEHAHGALDPIEVEGDSAPSGERGGGRRASRVRVRLLVEGGGLLTGRIVSQPGQEVLVGRVILGGELVVAAVFDAPVRFRQGLEQEQAL